MDENRGTTPGGNDASLRVPPHDLHAEQAVLASVLLNNDLINGVMEVLRPGDFYQGAHRILYEAMVDLYDRGRPIDQLTLSAVLKDRNAEQQVGGLAYLSEIVTSVPISANVVHYARIVKEKSILRKTISAAQEIAAAAFQGVADIDLFLDRTEQAIFSIAEEKIRPSYYVMGEMAREAMKEIEEAYERKERITGVASGFRDLDQVTAGFQRSNMIVVAARPGMGKTSLVLNVAVNAATRQKLPVAIFSLEMSRQELAMRMICSEARVNFQRLRTGHLAQEEVNRLVAAVGKLSEAPIFTDDSGTLSAMELRAKARRLKKERGIGMIIVDYLQLMHGSNTRAELRKPGAGGLRDLALLEGAGQGAEHPGGRGLPAQPRGGEPERQAPADGGLEGMRHGGHPCPDHRRRPGADPGTGRGNRSTCGPCRRRGASSRRRASASGRWARSR